MRTNFSQKDVQGSHEKLLRSQAVTLKVRGFSICSIRDSFINVAGESHEVSRVLLEKEMQGKLWSQRENYYSGLFFPV